MAAIAGDTTWHSGSSHTASTTNAMQPRRYGRIRPVVLDSMMSAGNASCSSREREQHRKMQGSVIRDCTPPRMTLSMCRPIAKQDFDGHALAQGSIDTPSTSNNLAAHGSSTRRTRLPVPAPRIPRPNAKADLQPARRPALDTLRDIRIGQLTYSVSLLHQISRFRTSTRT